MSRKPGIFDPWRQSEPPKAPTPPPALHDVEDDEVCVKYDAPGGGLNVWVPSTLENPGKVANARVQELVGELSRMSDPRITTALKKAGIGGNEVISPAKLSIAIRTAIALSPHAAKCAAVKRIKAYVK